MRTQAKHGHLSSGTNMVVFSLPSVRAEARTYPHTRGLNPVVTGDGGTPTFDLASILRPWSNALMTLNIPTALSPRLLGTWLRNP